MLITPDNIEKFLDQLDFESLKIICKPLEDFFGLTSFVYRKSYNDGTEINISNQPHWVEHLYRNEELVQHSVFDKHPSEYQSGFVLWSQLVGHQPILEQARAFNIHHGITIIKKMADGVEFCYFGTRSDQPEVVNHYLNNIDLLERFVLYFKEQASEMLKASQKNRIIVPHRFERSTIPEEDLLTLRQNTSRAAFLQATELKNVHLQGEFKGVTLSAREMEVAQCLLKGMTSEETGQAICLSSRTVEDYLNQLRDKFDAKNKSQLRQKLLKSDFITYFPQK